MDWNGPYDSGEDVSFSHAWCEICYPKGGTFYIRVKAKDFNEFESEDVFYKVVMNPEDNDPFVSSFSSENGRDCDQLDHVCNDDTCDQHIHSDGIDVVKKVGESPDIPIVNGPDYGLIGRKYEFKIRTTDPQDDPVFYNIRWGECYTIDLYPESDRLKRSVVDMKTSSYMNLDSDEGNKDVIAERWMGPYDSGEEVSFTHVWKEACTSLGGSFFVEVTARDVHGHLSEIQYVKVTLYRNPLCLFFGRIMEIVHLL
jgi:hypothetical protein